MINNIPDSWVYTTDLENLFMFYQASEEMLSYASPDSYRLTVHNTVTLCLEIKKIYSLLKRANQLDEYYSKYIPPIIEELISSIHKDDIIKKALGMRLDSVITGLTTANTNPAVLLKWINIIQQSCSPDRYMNECKKIICQCVIGGKDKNKMLYYTNNYYVCLINFQDFNPEFVYQQILKFFDNKYRKITLNTQIEDFFSLFDIEAKEIELYLVADTFLIDSFLDISPDFKSIIDIQKLSPQTIKAESTKNSTLKIFYDNYIKINGRENISMISYKSLSKDPYNTLEEIEEYFNLLQCLSGYFKHKTGHKVYFDVVQKEDDRYIPIKLRKIVPNRPYLQQEKIDHRILTILRSTHTPRAAFESIISALDMHLDAINCKNDETMLRTFWTATEALFFDPLHSGERENAIYSLSHVIDKIYLLKLFRTLFSMLHEAVTADELSCIGLSTFDEFIIFFASNQADSEEFKKISTLLGKNPLLRSRIYNLRKELSDSLHIKSKLEQHHKKVLWQIHRIYRTRNLSTHAGISMPYTKEILFNLHNYFDYVVNYIICKLENDEYVDSVSSLVFEAKNDNQIYMEFLKECQQLTEDNYLKLLFGPDKSLMDYEYEMIIPQ